MCLYANVFIPSKNRETIILHDAPVGLKYTIEGLIHENISHLGEGKDGVSLTLHDGHCLCQYEAWKVLFEYVNEIRSQNGLQSIELLIFWSDQKYPDLQHIALDLEIHRIDSKPQEGVVYTLGPNVRSRLELWTGKQLDILFKSGKRIFGLVKSFTPIDGNGMIITKKSSDSIYFHENEIKNVELSE